MEIIAILISPVIAVVVSIVIYNIRENQREKRKRRFEIYGILMSNRHRYSSPTEEMARAFNMIDVEFRNKKNVREIWHEYYDILINPEYNTDAGLKKRKELFGKLLQEITKVLGFGRKIELHDLNRIYYPKGKEESGKKLKESEELLLREIVELAKRHISPAHKGKKKEDRNEKEKGSGEEHKNDAGKSEDNTKE